MNKEQIIDLILDDNPTVDDILELIYKIPSGLSLDSILDSEREGIWEMEMYDVADIFTDRDLWNIDIDYHGTVEDMAKYYLCTLIDVFEIIGRDMYIYEDIIYQTLESMSIDELMDIILEV